jgi:hypothetical protein
VPVSLSLRRYLLVNFAVIARTFLLMLYRPVLPAR